MIRKRKQGSFLQILQKLIYLMYSLQKIKKIVKESKIYHFCFPASLILLRLFAFRKPKLNGSFLNPKDEELDNWFDLGVTPNPFLFIVLH